MGRYSFVMALEKGVDQNWHKDVDEPYRNMFGAAAFDGVNQAGGRSNPLWDIYPLPPPAPGSLVFLAVHDITRNMGPTEVLMGARPSCGLPARG